RSFKEWPKCVKDRDVVVITHEPEQLPAGVHTAGSLPAALKIAQTLRGDIFLCGGQRVYEEGLALADRLYLTLVHTTIEDGDTFFPDWREQFPREVARRDSRDERWRYTFFRLER